MSNSSSNSNSRSVSEQNRLIQKFVLDVVDLVLTEVDEPAENATFSEVSTQLHSLLLPFAERHNIDCDEIATEFADKQLKTIVELCKQDFARYPIQDPALSNLEEVLFASNGFWATVAHRIAHALRNLGVPIIPRAISGFAHSRTGIDIHPGATIGPGLFIDHGTGIAIGCTAVIHENVSLYNGVVLGTKAKPKKKTDDESGLVTKRHPTIGAGVSLYTNAFVGGDITVGENSIIGAYAFVTSDVPPGTAIKGKTGQDAQQFVNRHADVPPQTVETNDHHDNADATSHQTSNKTRPAVLSMIGNTPVVEIKNMHDNPRVKIFAKLEGANPSGSVKDRIALSLIEKAEESGALGPGKVILESTSGNTGIGLAMVGAAKGYEVVLTMSSAMSEERKKVVRAFGATLVQTDPTKGTGGAIEVANQMASDHPEKYWMSRQHSSLDNPLAHYEETADEILKQVPDVTHFVAGIGTFGTLRGAGGRLRKAQGVKVIGIEPVLGQAIQGLRNMNEPNPPSLYDESLLDEKMMAMADTAYSTTRELAEKEGLLVGMSSGAAMYGALQLAERLEEGTIVVLFPDRGEKYLSTTLFDAPKIEEEETEEQHEIAYHI